LVDHAILLADNANDEKYFGEKAGKINLTKLRKKSNLIVGESRHSIG